MQSRVREVLTDCECPFCGGRGARYAPFTVVVEVPYEVSLENGLKPVIREFGVCSSCYNGPKFKAYLRESERKADIALGLMKSRIEARIGGCGE